MVHYLDYCIIGTKWSDQRSGLLRYKAREDLGFPQEYFYLAGYSNIPSYDIHTRLS